MHKLQEKAYSSNYTLQINWERNFYCSVRSRKRLIKLNTFDCSKKKKKKMNGKMYITNDASQCRSDSCARFRLFGNCTNNQIDVID